MYVLWPSVCSTSLHYVVHLVVRRNLPPNGHLAIGHPAIGLEWFRSETGPDHHRSGKGISRGDTKAEGIIADRTLRGCGFRVILICCSHSCGSESSQRRGATDFLKEATPSTSELTFLCHRWSLPTIGIRHLPAYPLITLGYCLSFQAECDLESICIIGE